MLKVECESCKAPYQVDERRVPPTGLKMRCPKCGHTFLVTDPSKGAGAPPAPGAAPADRPKMKQTMVGVGAFGPGGKPPPMPPKPAGPPPGPPAAAIFDDSLILPAVKQPAPRIPTMAKPAPPPPTALPGLDDLDLPALASEVGLPAAVNRAPQHHRMAAPVQAAPQPPAFSFEVDLPAVQPAANHGGGGGFGSVDLPSAKRGGFGDLPSPKLGGSNLPIAKGGGAFGSIDLPTAKGGFNDLPMVQNDLPLVGGHNNLPMVGGHNNLPVASGNNNLPMVGGNLPMVGGNLPMVGGNLPMVGGNLPMAGGNLPMPRGGGFGEIDLPSVQNDLPNAMGAQAHMPMPVSDDRLLPNRHGGQPPPIAFGELDLPIVGGSGGMAPSQRGPDAVSFGELDLPADPSMGAPPLSMAPGQPAGGGMAFGEVDLGGGHGDSNRPVMGPPPATSAGSMFQEASLEGAPQGPATGMRMRGPATGDRSGSKAPKIIAALVALLVVGGAGLQFTPVGAFGYIYFSDKLHSGDYNKDALTAADAARAKLALDTYASAQQAADELADLKRRSPRSRPLAAYAAFGEYANQVRFGVDTSRGARAKTFIFDIPAGTEVPYLQSALAAQSAVSGELAPAKAALAVATAKEPKDGIQYDLAILRGEIALAERDNPGALAAFTEAAKTASNARSQFGLARAHYAMKSLAKAKAAADATLTASPSHAGGHTLRALLTWELQRDDVAALKELAIVLDEKARKAEGPNEVSSALAAKGWIMLARDRAGEARAAFDEAVKIDPRNVTALVGQGEVLYADGRYTEALTRFDEAVIKDPLGIAPMLGAAKTKIALERLADAKAQLTAARTRAPKDMGVALWLAKAEEALGNKTIAEKLYAESIDLADPTNPDAILAYSAFASFLASQGRTTEAQAKLDQARGKLPDTAALQRAFGDVAATQGHFDEALGHYQSALQKTPSDLGTRFRLGVTYRKMKRLEDAAKEFDTIVATDKDYPNIAVERGLLFEQSGDVQKALEQFQSAYEKTPKDVDLMLRVGAAYVSIGEVEKALPLLNKVKDQRPNSAEANHFIGRAYLRQGGLDSAAAMRYLQRAVELDPNRAEYHLYVAWAANEATPAQLGLARTEVDKALSLDKLLADGYWQRGVVSLRESAVNDAMKDLKHALDLKPARHEAHAALAECFEQKNDVPNAMSEWAKAIAGDDKVASWRYRYGRLLLEKNNAAEAAKHLAFAMEAGKKAQPRPGWLGRCAFEAGEALRKTGQKPQAIEAYQLYFELSPPSDPFRRDATRGLRDVGGSLDR
jgi:cellulose synthase operon protein C